MRLWRTYAGVKHPADLPGPDAAPVSRQDAEGPLRDAAQAWLAGAYDEPATMEGYEVVEDLVDADGRVVRWAATFEAVGEHPKDAPAWWWDWTPADDEVSSGRDDDSGAGQS